MDVAVFCFRRQREVYERFCDEFRRIFGKSMGKYWSNLIGFDVLLLDKKLLKPEPGQSSLEAAKEKFGQEAADLIANILEAEKKTTLYDPPDPPRDLAESQARKD